MDVPKNKDTDLPYIQFLEILMYNKILGKILPKEVLTVLMM
jgi:hypothetical protein